MATYLSDPPGGSAEQLRLYLAPSVRRVHHRDSSPQLRAAVLSTTTLCNSYNCLCNSRLHIIDTDTCTETISSALRWRKDNVSSVYN